MQPEASGRVQSRDRGSRLNMTSRLNWTVRGKKGRGAREKRKRENKDKRRPRGWGAEEREQKSAWLKWQGYIGRRSWGKESP